MGLLCKLFVIAPKCVTSPSNLHFYTIKRRNSCQIISIAFFKICEIHYFFNPNICASNKNAPNSNEKAAKVNIFFLKAALLVIDDLEFGESMVGKKSEDTDNKWVGVESAVDDDIARVDVGWNDKSLST